MDKELARIRELLARLMRQAIAYDSDKNNLRRSIHASLFAHQLFASGGKRLVPFVEEAQALLARIDDQLQRHTAQTLVRYQCDKLSDQCKALALALNSAGQRQQTSARDQRVRQIVAQRRQRSQGSPAQQPGGKPHDSPFDWLTASVMANSHQLYQELSKHQGYERRLSDKIAALENQLPRYQGADKIARQQEILRQHQRLGQCRKAMSFIEQRIQQMESGRLR